MNYCVNMLLVADTEKISHFSHVHRVYFSKNLKKSVGNNTFFYLDFL